MEGIIKKFILIVACLCSFVISASAEVSEIQQMTTPTNVSFSDCTRTYNISAEKLYLLALNAISANRFETRELQSKMGYVLFKAANKEFLVTIAYYSPNRSIIKITPANNNYYFAPGIVLNIFKYIDVYMDEPVIPIQKS